MDEASAGWRKSTHSQNGDCVEWVIDDRCVRVRNSRAPGAELSFTHSEWAAFLAGARAGEADLDPAGT